MAIEEKKTKEDYILEGRMLERKAILNYLRFRAETKILEGVNSEGELFTYSESKIDSMILLEIELHCEHYLLELEKE